MYTPLTIANYFRSKAMDGNILTPMKLNKLVYIAHGWNLAIAKSPLISEKPEAWKYGPVIPSLYREYKHYGGQSIPPINNFIGNLSPIQTKILDKVWDIYGNLDGIALSAKTHQPGTPWDIAWNDKGKVQHGYEISDNLIQTHYEQLLVRNKASVAQQ